MPLHVFGAAIKMASYMSDAAHKHDPYAPWRSRNFRFYAVSWFTMTFSKQVETLAVAIYLVDQVYGHSTATASLSLGMLGLVQALPVMLLAIAGGQLADRFDRRRVMMATLGLNATVSLGLVGVALAGTSPLWLYALLGLGAVGQALGGPSRAALLPRLVSREVFPNAIAWSSSIFYIASVTGPVVGGGMMVLSKNPAAAFVLVALCRVLSAVAIALIRCRQEDGSEQSISWATVVAGIRFVWRTKLILATITLDLFAVLLGGAVYLLPVYAKDILGVGPTGLGFLRAADAVGAMCMAMVVVHMPPMRRAGVTLLWAVAGFGLATIIFGLSTSFWLSMLMMFLAGALDNISVVVRHTLVQMLTPDDMRGRVSAVNGVFIVASNDLGGLESGLTAWLVGPVISVVGGGVGTILVVLAAMCLWPQILSLGSLHAIRPAVPEEPPTPA
jgi:MFS family permease